MENKYKSVTYKHLSIGQELYGWHYNDIVNLNVSYVKDINSKYVIVAMFHPKSDDIRYIDTCYEFYVEEELE